MNARFAPYLIGFIAAVAVIFGIGFFIIGLEPASADPNPPSVVFEVKKGEGFREVMGDLKGAGVIRSPFASATYSLFTGEAFRIQPGRYRLSPGMSVVSILGKITGAGTEEVTVTIPEGANIFQMDAILADALVIRPGELAGREGVRALEGRLFPDTYRFFAGSDPDGVVKTMTDTFHEKAAPLLGSDPSVASRLLTIASIVDKEVPDPHDQAIVAGIVMKRLAAHMPLQIDATICYAKLLVASGTPSKCYPLTPLDFKIDSPYNTYLYRGLPPGPIGNPGISAIRAAAAPLASPYWFYLSDPATGKTIFSKTLDEQAKNKVKYLKGN